MKENLFNLEGKVALVTGADGLLGRQFVNTLRNYGCEVIEMDKNYDMHLHHMDVKLKEEWQAVLKYMLGVFDRIDILVNCAAYTNQTKTESFSTSFEDMPLEDWNAMLDVNLTGTMLGCQVIGKQMLKQGFGSIINIASLYGLVAPHHPIYEGTGVSQPIGYSISKAGVLALTRYLGTLWASKGVRVNCITPGGVRNGHGEEWLKRYSELCPMGRMAEPDEMNGALIYLASDASKYVTGSNIVVDGGWTAW
jgi:NAD(P)-dependent dehydrogenase (short-subunit alcohol dehydrogenase family)